MKKTMILTLVVALAAFTAVQAQPGRRGGEGYHKGSHGDGFGHHEQMERRGGRMGVQHLLRMEEELKLSDNQVEQLKKMAVDFPLEMVDLRADAKKAKIVLEGLRMDENTSERAVYAAIDKVADARAAIGKLHYRHRQATLALLTDDQKAELKKLRKERFKKGGKMRGRPGGRMFEREIIIQNDGDM